MTSKEQIDKLLERIAWLEARLAAVEARPHPPVYVPYPTYVPYPSVYPQPFNPWGEITCT